MNRVGIGRVAGLAWACRAVIVVAAAGVFAPWRTSGPVSLDGFQGPHNGWLVLVFGCGAVGVWLPLVASVGLALAAVSGAVQRRQRRSSPA